MRKGITKNCIVCGAPFHAAFKEIKRNKGKCCSRSCAATLASKNRNQSGPNNNNWKGGSNNTDRKRRYRSANPEKHSAHLAMRKAIRRGELIPQPCAVCGMEKVEGHHHDYKFPLQVEWLCKKHHLKAHGGKF